MMMNILMNFAQFERQQTAERISANLRARTRRGLYNGGSVPLGYMSNPQEPGKLLIVENEAQVVRECYQTFLKEGSLSQAIKSLNQRGLAPKKGQNGTNKAYQRRNYFNTDTLYRILTNPIYIAKRSYMENGEEKFANAQWQPIMDEKTFKMVGERLKKNRCRYKPRHWKKHHYVLSGLVYCGECNGILSGKSAHGNTKKHFYYDHAVLLKKNFETNKSGCLCQKKRIRAIKLEEAVIDRIRHILDNSNSMNGLLEQAKSSVRVESIKNKIQDQKKRIKEIDRSLEALLPHLEALPAGTKAQVLYKRISDLETLKENLGVDLHKLESDLLLNVEVIEPQEYIDFLKFLVSQIDDASFELKKALLHTIIHKIIVYKDNIEVIHHVGRYILDGYQLSLAPEEAAKKNLNKGSHTLTNGASGENRTLMSVSSHDFESCASTSSATEA